MEKTLLNICGFDSSKKFRLEELTKYYQSGSCIDFEDVEEEEDDEMFVDYPCPFCSDDYDLVELCHHIDEEHQLDANNGICPICSKQVKIHMVDHITTQHKDITSYLEQKQNRLYKNDESSYSSLSPKTKKYLQSLIDEPISMTTNHTTSKTVPDSFLSFVYNPSSPNNPQETSLKDKSFVKDSTQKDRKSLSPLTNTELIEKAKKREFVTSLISSTIFDHIDDCF